jgi:ParB family transcriptional regulator, chromosome partitioning protein
MAKGPHKLTLSPSRDIPFDRLVLSQANVRRVKTGVSIPELADDIYRRTLLQSLNVRPMLDDAGNETGMFEVPAGGRRYRALEMLVKTKRMASTALIPCIVKPADSAVSAEEDSFAENTFRQSLHPLDQFRAMQTMVDQGNEVEAIAAHFMTTPAVVRQRLKLASVSPALHAIYAVDGMTLDQLMAFSVSDDHPRQEQVWEMLTHSHNKSAAYIRARLTEDGLRVADKRVRFVTVEAYVAAGGAVMRDLFEPDDGGWLTDPALLDRLVDAKLKNEAAAIEAEGWKWVTTAVDLPWNAASGMRAIVGMAVPMTDEQIARVEALQEEGEAIETQWSDESDVPTEVHARLDAIDVELRQLAERPVIYADEDVLIAGTFVSIARDGSLSIDRGHVRPEDEPVTESEGDGASDGREPTGGKVDGLANGSDGGQAAAPGGDDDDADEVGLKPLSERLVAELTAWRTLALQDAFAQDPVTAYVALLHALVLDAFYHASRESCVQVSVRSVSFGSSPDGLGDSAPARAIVERTAKWKARLPKADAKLWDALLGLDAAEQAELLAHCLSAGVNAQQEALPKYDNGRISPHSLERRIAHSHVLAQAVGLDLVDAGWKPTVDGYFRSVTKPRILADVAEAKGQQFAEMIAHLKKGDMAREAERLLDDAQWLPEPMRTPASDAAPEDEAADVEVIELPAFLDDDCTDGGPPDENDFGEGEEPYAMAAE